MKLRFVMSIIISIFILSAGIFGLYYIHDKVPKRLNEPSNILASEATEVNPDDVESKELKEIIQETQKKVVKIELANGTIGSGFIYSDKGDIVTNAHVVAGETDVVVVTSDAKEFSGIVIGVSEDTDVALVRVAGLEGVEPLKLREEKAEIGDEVLALGSPLGLENTVTIGIISGIDRDFDLDPYHYEDVYQISAPIAPGNSGGPLVHSESGEVLGINSVVSDVGTIGFSIPIRNVLTLIEEWSAT
ncbi:S1C family serine protease [Virgibacillus soli]|uniref:Trypsin-like peptidase domain-containing protein n=1 Tax=Paracerasibacillus soli TaxID=480284 RepID=A0ABU5CSZ1_9BACI|nr:trypsin-like peptidase domain-containing protein [Virgibacillus soli]MDY0408986.1 trypsin-like peptidase domain-containing protein [Virgibacillus soli]